MPWPKQYRLQSGSTRLIRTDAGEKSEVAARRNRHSFSIKQRIVLQALRLEQEEVRARADITYMGAPSRMQPIRGVRREGESNLAVGVCNMYLRIPRRSLIKLHGLLGNEYSARGRVGVPTLDTLKSWSRRYEWQARAFIFDAANNGIIANDLDFWRQDEIVRKVREILAQQ